MQRQLQDVRSHIDERLQDATDSSRFESGLTRNLPEELEDGLRTDWPNSRGFERPYKKQARNCSRRWNELGNCRRPRSQGISRCSDACSSARRANLETQLHRSGLAQAVMAGLPRPQPTCRSTGLDRATRYLESLWNEPGLQLDYDTQQDSILVTRQDESRRRLMELSEMVQQQVLDCLQLSLVRTLARRGVHLPLVVQDEFLGTSASVARRTASLLCQLAVQGQQILLVTDKNSVAEIFQELGMPTLVVTRIAPPAKPQPTASHRPEGASL